MILLQTLLGVLDSWRSGVRRSPNLSCWHYKDETSARSLANPPTQNQLYQVISIRNHTLLQISSCVSYGQCLSLPASFPHFKPKHCDIIIKSTFMQLYPWSYFDKWRKQHDLPSPASVWGWWEVNGAVRTAVNVNLVKTKKAQRMKNWSQLILMFMPPG